MNFKEIHNCAQCGHRESPNKKSKTIEKWLCFFGIFPFFLVPPWLIFWTPFAVWCLLKRHKPVCANCGWEHPVPVSRLSTKLKIN